MLYDCRNDVEFLCTVCDLRKTDFGRLTWVTAGKLSAPTKRAVMTCLSCVASGAATPDDE